MNHDITHCNGEGCPVCGTCHRYQAHLDLLRPARVNEPFTGWPSYTSAKHCIENNLNLYWKEESDGSNV
jgi:hypothetical protein